jgi:hypothetical protein
MSTPTTYHILAADGSRATHTVDWPHEPGYDRIKQLIEPLLDGAHLEHVTVLHDGQRADMFVDKEGHCKDPPLSRNEAATAIYRAATLRRAPKTNPESIPYVVGTAILFDRLVWF